jgi:hypothetical protein
MFSFALVCIADIPKKVIIQWDDQGHGSNIIPFDGIPFVYLNYKMWACHLGLARVQGFMSKSMEHRDDSFNLGGGGGGSSGDLNR